MFRSLTLFRISSRRLHGGPRELRILIPTRGTGMRDSCPVYCERTHIVKLGWLPHTPLIYRTRGGGVDWEISTHDIDSWVDSFLLYNLPRSFVCHWSLEFLCSISHASPPLIPVRPESAVYEFEDRAPRTDMFHKVLNPWTMPSPMHVERMHHETAQRLPCAR